MTPILHNFSLQAGGSHYPTINPKMQEEFAKMIIEKCAELASQPTPAPYNSYSELILAHFGMQDGRETSN
jgi:hypothetical protein